MGVAAALDVLLGGVVMLMLFGVACVMVWAALKSIQGPPAQEVENGSGNIVEVNPDTGKACGVDESKTMTDDTTDTCDTEESCDQDDKPDIEEIHKEARRAYYQQRVLIKGKQDAIFEYSKHYATLLIAVGDGIEEKKFVFDGMKWSGDDIILWNYNFSTKGGGLKKNKEKYATLNMGSNRNVAFVTDKRVKKEKEYEKRVKKTMSRKTYNDRYRDDDRMKIHATGKVANIIAKNKKLGELFG